MKLPSRLVLVVNCNTAPLDYEEVLVTTPEHT